MLSLTHRETRDMRCFLETLASPLTFADSSTWRREVMSTGRRLLGAERAVFALEWEPRPMEDEGLDPDAAPAYQAYYHQLDLGHHERRRRRRAVLGHCLQLAEGWNVGSAEFREDFLRRYRLDRGAGMAHDAAPGASAWCVFYPDAEPRDEFEARVLPMLELVYPVFRAGLETLRRTSALRADFVRLLDVCTDGFRLLGLDGRVLHQNPALTQTQPLDPEWHRVEEVMNAVRQRLLRSRRDPAAIVEPWRTTLATTRASYEISATIPGPELASCGVGLVLQVVTRVSALPSSQMLCDRFGLTRREADVVRSLAEGLSYASAAQHLGISIDTVRSHIRRIYATLEVQSATEAVSRILRERW